MSVARQILREKEATGLVVPYIRESGFVVYTSKSEIEKREGGAPIMTADVFEEVAASVSHEPVIDEEMEAALAAAASVAGTAVKPGRLARKRREAGERKERKESRPEVLVEPLEPAVAVTESKQRESAKEVPLEETVKKPTKAPKASTKAKSKPRPSAKDKAKPSKETKKAAAPEKVDEKPVAKKEPTKKAPAKKLELTDIDGVGPKTAESLRSAGFKTVASLAKTDAAKLAKKVDGIGETAANNYIEAAKKLLGDSA
jgi:predicted flap endonuclease-1-like 5' DNA nuclease